MFATFPTDLQKVLVRLLSRHAMSVIDHLDYVAKVDPAVFRRDGLA
jgi:hypothetical protein